MPDFQMRQSTLAVFSRCPLSARFELEAGERYGPALNRGTLAHRVVAECLRTMHRNGERRIPQPEALEILWEVLAQRDIPSDEVITLSPEERINLRQFVSRFAADYEFDVRRIISIEEPLTMPIRCPDGATRILKGTPDLILAAPPNGVIAEDFKSGWAPPVTPRDPDDVTEPRRYLTARGHYQLDSYGLLAMHHYPRAEWVMLREDHPRSSERREAKLWRADMAEVERLIGVDLMLMDRALSEGPDSPIWKPVPGKQCAWCVKRQACPRPPLERGAGMIQDADVAAVVAQNIEAITPQRTELIDAAKAWVDVHGPIPLPDGRVLGWEPTKSGGRRFAAHVPELEPVGA